jgi:DNA-binding transcriptional ArsR family regulator
MAPRRQPQERTSPPPRGSVTHVRTDPVYVRKAQLFRVLGHPVRIRALELLIEGERTVGDLQAALGLDSSGASQHLAALRQQGVLERRRDGTSVYYRIRDPRVSQLMTAAEQILTSALSDTHAMLADLVEQPRARVGR